MNLFLPRSCESPNLPHGFLRLTWALVTLFSVKSNILVKEELATSSDDEGPLSAIVYVCFHLVIWYSLRLLYRMSKRSSATISDGRKVSCVPTIDSDDEHAPASYVLFLPYTWLLMYSYPSNIQRQELKDDHESNPDSKEGSFPALLYVFFFYHKLVLV